MFLFDVRIPCQTRSAPKWICCWIIIQLICFQILPLQFCNWEKNKIEWENRERNQAPQRSLWSFSCTRSFRLSLPPPIHLSPPQTHPPNSPLTLQGRPCLPSVVCPSQEQPPIPPPVAFTIQLKATSSVFLLPLLFLRLLFISLCLDEHSRKAPCSGAVMTHTLLGHSKAIPSQQMMQTRNDT